MSGWLSVIRSRLAGGETLALATVIARTGSAPRGRGARLLADASGLIHGTVGGGAAEAAVLEACADVLRGGGCRLLDLNLTNAMAAKEGMVCGGAVRVFVEQLTPDQETRDFFAAVEAALCAGGGTLLTRLFAGGDAEPERALYAAGSVLGTPPDGVAGQDFAAASASLAEAALIMLDGREYFADPLLPPDRMILAGAGHVALPTVTLAASVGFTVHVLDDRPEFVRPERFPRAASTRAVPEFADCFVPFAPDARTFIVIVTRGHFYDQTVLEQALRTEAGYIGMIGSRKKRDTLYAAIRERGFSDADLARVRCPVGLAIGAETPEEIAVSIVGECIAHKRGVLQYPPA